MTDQDQQRSVLAEAVLEMRRLRTELAHEKQLHRSPIAIVGMSCRMPGAEDSAAFWELLRDGRSGISKIGDTRWKTADYYSAEPGRAGKITTEYAGLLADVSQFDAAFFGISAREAAALDPQQRLLLEVTWEAIEDAAIRPDTLAGSATGVFFGVTNYDYLQTQLQQQDPTQLEAYSLTSNASTFAAGRTSYWLGLNGPSLSVDTACSSSLVSLHLACQSLRSGECDAALAGGVNVLLSPEWFVVLSQAKMLATDGVCKTFDAAADGYVRSEGCGVVMLKRLADAEAAGDRILAVIRGSAVNQDGRSGGIMVPNASAQQAVVRSALAQSSVAAHQVSYVEAHGTGTPLGDPIELRALNAVLGDRSGAGPLLVGSVKTNVGHLEPAAGMAGLIKVVLALRHERIPPHLNLNTVNPDIGLDELQLQIPTEGATWPRSELPRIAGISSFGASGTNAHVIVAEAPALPPAEPSDTGTTHVLTLSARTPSALTAMARRYAQALTAQDADDPADVCFTANTGRARFGERLAVVAGSAAELAAGLLGEVAGERVPGVTTHTGRVRPQTRSDVVFLFTGQGAQYPGMARALYADEPVFRTAVDRLADAVADSLDRDLRAIIDPDPADADLIHQTRYTQPALFAVEYALAQLWCSRGIEPSAVLGHSVGELVAACVAGMLTPEDGIGLAVVRGELMHRFGLPAAMASVSAGETTVMELIAAVADEVSIAAVNGSENTAIAGSTDGIEAVLAACSARGIGNRRLPVERGFHSPMIEPALNPLQRAAASLRFGPARIPVISNVTGASLTELTPEYLREHARRPVQFLAGVNTLMEQGYRMFLEVGPTPSLTTMTRAAAAELGIEITAVASMRPRRDDAAMLADATAALWSAGATVDWPAVHGSGRRRVALPTYPFDHEHFWFEAGSHRSEARAAAPSAGPGEPSARLLGTRLLAPLDVLQYEAILDSAVHDCLADCVLDGVPVVNIGVYLDAVLSAWAENAPRRGSTAVTDLVVLHSLVSSPEQPMRTQLLLTPPAAGGSRFGYFSMRQGPDRPQWLEHTRGVVNTVEATLTGGAWQRETALESVTAEQTGDAFYRDMWRRNLLLGPSARWVEHLWRSTSGAVARMRAPQADEAGTYLLPPGLTDALFQTLFSCLPKDIGAGATFMIVGMDRFVVHSVPAAGTVTHCQARLDLVSDDRTMIVARVKLYGPDGALLIEASGVSLKRAVREQLAAAAPTGSASFATDGPAATRAPDLDSACEIVLAVVARALGTDPSRLVTDEPLQNLGLDSLMALEIKSGLFSRLGVSLPLVTFLQARDLAEIQELALAGLGSDDTEAAAPEPQPIELQLAARHEPFELTDLQQAYLVGRDGAFELGETSTYFYVEVDVTEIDVQLLERGLRQGIERHDMLRAVMTPDGHQRVLADVPDYRIAMEDLRELDHLGTQRRLDAIGTERRNAVLDPQTWPLFDVRATLIDGEWTRLHVGFDALIIDAWSTMLLFQEWAEAYRGVPAAPPLDLTFRDYTSAIRAREGGGAHELARRYWFDRVDTLPPAPALPVAVDPGRLTDSTFTHRSVTLSTTEWQQLADGAAALGLTPSTMLCAAYAQILAAWSESSHFTLNLLFFNRQRVHPDVDRVLGNFSATTLLEVLSPPEETFAVRATRLQHQLWQDLEHSAVSGVQVLRELNRHQGSAGRAGMPVVFASTINFGARSDSAQFSGLAQHLVGLGAAGREVSSSIRTPQVWLDHQVVEDNGTLKLNWDSVDAIFPAGMVGQMFDAYVALVRELATDPASWHRRAAVVASPSQLALRAQVNRTEVPRQPELLQQRFEHVAATEPHRCAVIAVDRTLSYGELDRAAENIADQLMTAGTPGDSLVAIVMHKGWQQVAAVLGILKAGSAYVPVDAGLPPERLALVLANAGVTSVITQPGPEADLQWPANVSRFVVDDAVFQRTDTAAAPRPVARPDGLAYVIFTSGSTGVPKGVMIEHAGAVNTVRDVNDRCGAGAEDRVLGLSALNFDLSVYDVFGPLSVGGALVLPSPSDHREPARWVELVRRHGVTIWNSVPTLMEMFTESALTAGAEVKSIRLVMMSGDWIPVRLPERISTLLPQAAIWSLGGATEASIWSIVYPIDAVDPSWVSIPYGLPMANQRWHVLNSELQPCPDWVSGDLYIAGAGLAHGYLGDEYKTRRSFVVHPLTGERLYRTGDQGRYRPDGVIEFLGRNDSQVKINGYRVELGEIEAAMSQVPGVAAAVAVAAGSRTGAKRIIGYVVGEPGTVVDPEQVTAHVHATLPSYCVPQQILPLDALPLSSNGKLDRSKLVKSNCPVADPPGTAVAPSTETEQWLADLWQQFFPDSTVGVEQSFFDLGGNSLDAVRLVARLHERTGRSHPLGVLFTHPTIRSLATVIGADAAEQTSLVPIRSEGQETPLVLVHPVGGDVLCYHDLVSRLPHDRPVFGVQAPPADAPGSATLVELATRYADDIRHRLPGGRCRIGGWSMGAALALEVAGQLEESGFVVEQLLCIDLGEPPGPAPEQLTEQELLAWFCRDLAGLGDHESIPSTTDFQNSDGPGTRLLLDWAHTSGVLDQDVDLATIETIFSRFSRNLQALLGYRPRPYRGSVRLLFAAENPSGAHKVAESWLALMSGDARMIELPGTHYSIMRAPHVGELARHLKAALSEPPLEQSAPVHTRAGSTGFADAAGTTTNAKEQP
ncbi:non-ribosomal peptide synthetase/type I polyketide synthase [Jatrophihabitans lederbergiae]|uniref:Phenyloxazoline synthase MbtB n=1 Tax=Jatrophihabitans lederbergiae TaxID=3075547 RepID=A0ABU2JFQ6_9ACTN|nr:non-ribosomal peptide synthetase/type I polyketide synthase [Jatrophihabitans sp. DSM 44399]MDT0263830.1 amino acid adenylation domain-containing protein [Jatrophihabitans sp. DSM 44399]